MSGMPTNTRPGSGKAKAAIILSAMPGRHDKPGGLTTRDWCSKFGVQMMPTQEAHDRSQRLSGPAVSDHPEQHEALAQQVLRSGKPTYIDKTFAPDHATVCACLHWRGIKTHRCIRHQPCVMPPS